jgi:hypothetical protein
VLAELRTPASATAAIVHSHGLQVAAFAAAEHNVKFSRLISVGSPIRKDMSERPRPAEAAAPMHSPLEAAARAAVVGEGG